MSLQLANAIVTVFELYALIGVVFAVVFLPRGVVGLDPRVADAPRTLRLLIFPGVAAFWPLFAWRWLVGAGEPIENNPHRARARSAPAHKIKVKHGACAR